MMESLQRALFYVPCKFRRKRKHKKTINRGNTARKMAHNALENYLTRFHVSLLTWDTQTAVYIRHVCEHPVYRSSSIRVVYVLLLRINYYLPWIFRRKEREKTATDRQGSRIPYTVMFACILYAQLSGHKFSREPPLCNTQDESDGTRDGISVRGEANICRPSQIIPLSFTDRKLGTSMGWPPIIFN